MTEKTKVFTINKNRDIHLIGCDTSAAEKKKKHRNERPCPAFHIDFDYADFFCMIEERECLAKNGFPDWCPLDDYVSKFKGPSWPTKLTGPRPGGPFGPKPEEKDIGWTRR